MSKPLLLLISLAAAIVLAVGFAPRWAFAGETEPFTLTSVCFSTHQDFVDQFSKLLQVKGTQLKSHIGVDYKGRGFMETLTDDDGKYVISVILPNGKICPVLSGEEYQDGPPVGVGSPT